MLTSREVHRGVRLSLQVLDRELACMVSHEEPYAVISITDPTFEHPTLLSTPTCRAVLRLRFSDVDERFARLNVTSHFLAAFCPTMAGEIAAFVEEQLALNTRLIVVHCEAGVSRSAGVASALSRHYKGEDSFFHGHYRPNRWVRQVLLDALQGSVPKEPQLKLI